MQCSPIGVSSLARLCASLSFLLLPGAAGAELGPAAALEVLPPLVPWEGVSREWIAAEDDPWITPAEKDGLERSPSYDETVAYLERLVAAAPELQMLSLGKSPEGRDIWLVVASAEGVSTPGGLAANGRPTLLAQAGIHSGEIDGKDAGLMLLRDLTVGGKRRALLDQVNLLFIPILSVDGHERSSPHSRMNQRGPESMGWRTTSANLNLNRDFAKMDTPEMRALIRGLGRWEPDLYLDLHVTDGADYQYDVTYGWTGTHGYSPAIAGWLDTVLAPAFEKDLSEAGHIPGPLVFLVNNADPMQGNFGWTAGPRYSNGYGDARHLPTVLVENHSLKPYPQRVLGTYALVLSAMETLAERGDVLARAIESDRGRRPAEVPMSFGVDPDRPLPKLRFLGIASRVEPSEVSGADRLIYTGEEIEIEIPWLVVNQPQNVVERPVAYWIPPAWNDVIDRLAIHGIGFERISEAREVEVEMLRLDDPVLAPRAFEGRVQVTSGVKPERRTWKFPAGSVRVPTDQPLGILAMLLLEPQSPDSFFQWGFFHSILSRIEYAEAYVMEPLAERMLAEDPALAAAFRNRLEDDAEFAADPRARLEWFYRRTPYWDERYLLYPVARELR